VSFRVLRSYVAAARDWAVTPLQVATDTGVRPEHARSERRRVRDERGDVSAHGRGRLLRREGTPRPARGANSAGAGCRRHAREAGQKADARRVGFLAVTIGFAVAGFGNLLSSLATIVAALTLAIGFASQDLIGNLVAGAFLIGDPKVKIGDWIEWNDNEGIIEDISFRVSRIRTFDNGLITVPNSELANTALENPVAKDKRRLQFLFGVGYEEDLDHARDVSSRRRNAHSEILADPGA